MSQPFASGGQSIGASASAVSPSKEYSGLIFFRINWFDLLAVQGTLKSLLQHHISKASILRCSAFFMVQLSYPYKRSGKTMALTRQIFFSKVMSLFFNMLFRFGGGEPRNRASLVAHIVKNPPAMREALVQSLGWGDPLEEGMASHSSILAWRIPMDRGAWQAIVYGVTKSWTRLSD